MSDSSINGYVSSDEYYYNNSSVGMNVKIDTLVQQISERTIQNSYKFKLLDRLSLIDRIFNLEFKEYESIYQLITASYEDMVIAEHMIDNICRNYNISKK